MNYCFDKHIFLTKRVVINLGISYSLKNEQLEACYNFGSLKEKEVVGFIIFKQ